jgi:hypothetical protein
MGMEVGAMPAGVGDMVGETGQPLQGVHGLEVSAERGVHAGAIQHGFPAVEVDELLKREGRSHEVAGHALDGLLVLEGDRVAEVCGEAWMLPGEELAREIVRDRVALDEAGEQSLPEQLHDRFAVPGREGMKRAIVREATVAAPRGAARPAGRAGTRAPVSACKPDS